MKKQKAVIAMLMFFPLFFLSNGFAQEVNEKGWHIDITGVTGLAGIYGQTNDKTYVSLSIIPELRGRYNFSELFGIYAGIGWNGITEQFNPEETSENKDENFIEAKGMSISGALGISLTLPNASTQTISSGFSFFNVGIGYANVPVGDEKYDHGFYSYIGFSFKILGWKL